MKWWPFGKKSESAEQAESQFQRMIDEAMLRQDDLEKAAEALRAERQRRMEDLGIIIPPRPKLNSQTG